MKSPAVLLSVSLFLPFFAMAEDSESQAQETSGVFMEPQAITPQTETQERAAKAIADRYPDAEMSSLRGGTDTRRGYRAAPFIFMGPAGFMQSRFKAEIACSLVSLEPEAKPVFAMFFISPKEKRGVLVVDTPVSAAACAPKGDVRRTGEGMKEFRDFMESHDAYSKNFFRKIFGK